MNACSIISSSWYFFWDFFKETLKFFFLTISFTVSLQINLFSVFLNNIFYYTPTLLSNLLSYLILFPFVQSHYHCIRNFIHMLSTSSYIVSLIYISFLSNFFISFAIFTLYQHYYFPFHHTCIHTLTLKVIT